MSDTPSDEELAAAEAAFEGGYEEAAPMDPEIGAGGGAEPEPATIDDLSLGGEPAAATPVEIPDEDLDAHGETFLNEADRQEAMQAEREARQEEAEQTPAESADDAPTLAELVGQLDELNNRVRRNEGHLGRVQQQQQEMAQSAAQVVEAGGGDAPTQQQIDIALDDVEEFVELKNQFPEFAAALEALERRRATATPTPTPTATAPAEGEQPLTQEQMLEIAKVAAREELIEDAHPGWTETILSERFGAWKDAQPEEIQALGASDRANAAVKMLNEYKKFTDWVDQVPNADRYTEAALLDGYAKSVVESATSEETPRASSQDRLAASVPATTPSGRRTGGAQQQTDDDAFVSGFKDARG